jgi:hypothetical protein
MNLAAILVLFLATQFLVVRQVTETGLLGDVLSHSHRTLQYENPITHFHENCHAANSAVNKQFKRPGFYLLNNRCFVLDKEPSITVGQLADRIPQSLRDHHSYQWYLIQVPRMNANNDRFSSVIIDEWIAFKHSSHYRNEIQYEGQELEVEYMLAFTVYTVVMFMNIDHGPEVTEFLKEQIDEVKQIYLEARSLPHKKADDYLRKFLTAPDCAEIRRYMKEELELEFR